MAKLFENNKSFDFISLRKLAQGYLEDDTERVELAGFQRGAAWKAANVEDLWDSLLRWFPIGSILLARTSEFKQVRYREPQLSRSADYTEISQEDSDEEIYILIDGQQRSNAIALGFLPWSHPKAAEAGARLWIELGEPANKQSKQYEFYLCTNNDPFGEGITKAQKRQALKNIEKEGLDDSELFLDETFPARAKLPLPFAEFVQAIEVIGAEKEWEVLKEYLLQNNRLCLSDITLEFIKEKLSNVVPRADFQQLLSSIQEVILKENYVVPAILFRNRDDRVSSTELGKVFERINVNGVTPPQAELFFSALKLRWPEIGDYVAVINKVPILEGLLRPTEIIHAALRLVKPEYMVLNLENFESITTDHKQRLRDLLAQTDGENGIFQRCMQLAYEALHYRDQDDYGLPRQLINRLRPRVWHTILYWIFNHLEKIGLAVSEADRFEMVRFAMLDAMDYFLFRYWWRGYSSFTNHTMFYNLLLESQKDAEQFSAKEVFTKVKKRVSSEYFLDNKNLHILSPEEYREWISPENSRERLNWNSHLAGDVLLMYAQRKYLTKWQSLDDLDKDHIVPYNWMNFRGPTGNREFWKLDQGSVGVEGRSPVLNSPGNFRYWPASLNRQYQHINPTRKFIQKDYELELDDNHKLRGLFSVGDILEASFIDLDLVDMFEELERFINGDYRIWTLHRYNTFKRLVDERCCRMYQDLYTTLKLGEINS